MVVGDAFDSEAGVFEVEEQGCLETGDVEITEHLGQMTIVETADHLGIDDDFSFDNEVGNESADELPIVVDRMLLLLFANEPLFGEFDDEGAFVELFIETGLEGEEHFVSGSDNHFG